MPGFWGPLPRRLRPAEPAVGNAAPVLGDGVLHKQAGPRGELVGHVTAPSWDGARQANWASEFSRPARGCKSTGYAILARHELAGPVGMSPPAATQKSRPPRWEWPQTGYYSDVQVSVAGDCPFECAPQIERMFTPRSAS